MEWIMRVFSLALKLYPQSFRDQFAAEMEEVFSKGLEEAREQGVIVDFILREILRLPGSLAGIYIWSMRAGEESQIAISSAAGGK